MQPEPADFNRQVSLSEFLKPGDDSSRWSTQQAARIEGYAIDIAYARPEAATSLIPSRCDLHIVVANRKNAPQNEQVVLEDTEPSRVDWSTRLGLDGICSAKTLLDHWCEFEGWLYFDVGHAPEAENTAPRNPGNWRATAWEIHSLTKFAVIK